MHVELTVDVLDVGGHGIIRDEELLANVGARASLGEKLHDFGLALREAVALPQHLATYRPLQHRTDTSCATQLRRVALGNDDYGHGQKARKRRGDGSRASCHNAEEIPQQHPQLQRAVSHANTQRSRHPPLLGQRHDKKKDEDLRQRIADANEKGRAEAAASSLYEKNERDYGDRHNPP